MTSALHPLEGGHLLEKETPMSLESLLEEVAAGRSEAFEELYRRVAGSVHGMAFRVLRGQAHAEEVTQEVFVQVWKEAARFDPSRGTALSWILTLAHRRAVDRVRSTEAASARETAYETASASVPFDSVADEVETSLERERVRKALTALTDLQRQTVLLAYYRGYTQKQVADTLGVPLGTVKTRMRDGIIRLRDELEVEG